MKVSISNVMVNSTIMSKGQMFVGKKGEINDYRHIAETVRIELMKHGIVADIGIEE